MVYGVKKWTLDGKKRKQPPGHYVGIKFKSVEIIALFLRILGKNPGMQIKS